MEFSFAERGERRAPSSFLLFPFSVFLFLSHRYPPRCKHVNLFPSLFFFLKNASSKGKFERNEDFLFSNFRFVANISRRENRRRKKMLIGCNALMYICSRRKGELGRGGNFILVYNRKRGPLQSPGYLRVLLSIKTYPLSGSLLFSGKTSRD